MGTPCAAAGRRAEFKSRTARQLSEALAVFWSSLLQITAASSDLMETFNARSVLAMARRICSLLTMSRNAFPH